MYKNQLDNFEVGNTVVFKGTPTERMIITHLETRWFKDNVCNLIYQLPDKKMNTLSNVPLKSIRKLGGSQ